jgi:hypothetical protein
MLQPASSEIGPVIYSTPSQGSPVRGAPGELLLIAGDGLSSRMVVYYKRVNGTEMPAPPSAPLPTTPTAEQGPATTVSAAGAGNGLIVMLPAAMEAGPTYALWATTPRWSNAGWMPSAWSNGVRINDARPLWITPSRHFRSFAPAWLPRVLKLVGRNLHPAPGATTLVRLSRPDRSSPITLTAAVDPLDRYVARVQLPALMMPAAYAVSVSRDGGVNWVKLEGQSLEIAPNPRVRPIYRPADYGCAPDDDQSDTPCVMAAIADAAAAVATAGAGEVELGAGTWNLGPAGVTDQNHGIVVPSNVSLRGAGASTTVVRRSRDWTALAVFTLEGKNEVSGIRFDDPRRYYLDSARNTFFLLGRWTYMGAIGTVDDIVFHDNVFARPYLAISNGMLPIRRLVVRGNEFGAYHDALYLDGNPTPSAIRFQLEDSIIAGNTFKPGAYHDPNIGQGTIATQIGASLRLDFSDNQADGRSTDYLDETDTRGWRAAFFFHARNNHEKLLIANNVASCTGDKGGDGEFIAFDSNANRFAFTEVQPVAAANANAVTVIAALENPSLPEGYFSEHWVQVVAGRGVGQTRKVTSYTTSPSQSTFTVSPAWDVVPDPASSRVLVSRQWWQALVLSNQVDIRDCLKPRKNVSNQVMRHGTIILWAPTVDSVVHGNVQHESDGILLNARHFLPWQQFPTDHHVQYFVDVRSNSIDGESDHGWTCSRGGIQLWHAATPGHDLPMLPTLGVTVAENWIRRADSSSGGGIAFERAWFDDAPGTHWESTLLFRNTIREINDPPPSDDPSFGCYGSHPRVAVHINDAHIANTVLQGNNVIDCSDDLIDNGSRTVVLP